MMSQIFWGASVVIISTTFGNLKSRDFFFFVGGGGGGVVWKKIKHCLHPGNLVTGERDQEIFSVSGILPHKSGRYMGVYFHCLLFLFFYNFVRKLKI